MKNKPGMLDIFLHDKPIGTITRLADDRNVFSFNEDYIHNPERPTLSLAFKDRDGGLLTNAKPTHTRLHPFFSNLLPEGYMRKYLAAQAQVNPEREFFLLAALGQDLPGALKVSSAAYTPFSGIKEHIRHGKNQPSEPSGLYFSLTGFQLKFSAVWEYEKKLTIPVNGVGGSWIVKLPSPTYKDVPRNEFAMMELARKIGIDVPQTALIAIEKIGGIPDDITRFGTHAFAIKRFDRQENGEAIHMEDFAQIFSLYPEKKYSAVNYRAIVEVIFAELGTKGIIEFFRRFVFTVLTGNGDMHSKNWSLIYPDKRTPMLAPAYDLVTTLPYLPDDSLALNFLHNKAYRSITLKQFEAFAATSRLPQKLVIDTVQETVARFAQVWEKSKHTTVDETIATVLDKHIRQLPLWEIR